jgi:hypothetical protein
VARLVGTHTDNTRTCPVLSGDTPPGQTRTCAFRHVQMSGVRTTSKPDGPGVKNFGGQPYEPRPVSTCGRDE